MVGGQGKGIKNRSWEEEQQSQADHLGFHIRQHALLTDWRSCWRVTWSIRMKVRGIIAVMDEGKMGLAGQLRWRGGGGCPDEMPVGQKVSPDLCISTHSAGLSTCSSPQTTGTIMHHTDMEYRTV